MPTLAEMLTRSINPETKTSNREIVTELCAPISLRGRPHRQYEVEVFNFLLANRQQLGIKAVMRFAALRMDGAVELVDGNRLAIEIKFRMNWLKACQAEWQFRRFLAKKDRR